MNTYPIARRRVGHKTGMANGGWCYDNYPELQPLNANSTVEIANINGPGVVTCFHVTQHPVDLDNDDLPLNRRMGHTARGIVLEVFYDGAPEPSIRSPLADFFADGCGGKSVHYSTPFMEKLPESYNCYIPLPFKENLRVVLRNDTAYNCMSYSFVEYEQLPEWDEELMYLHASWNQENFRLTPDTEHHLITIKGSGQLIGNHYSIVTSEPFYKVFNFVMEGNCEHRIDGEEKPSIDYLGTEDSFCFSWGFREEFCGLYTGINHLQVENLPYELSIYRFRDRNPIIFDRGLDITINWKHEFTNGRRDYNSPARERTWKAIGDNGGQVQYSTNFYWYQTTIGFDHPRMPSLEARTADLET